MILNHGVSTKQHGHYSTCQHCITAACVEANTQSASLKSCLGKEQCILPCCLLACGGGVGGNSIARAEGGVGQCQTGLPPGAPGPQGGSDGGVAPGLRHVYPSGHA